MEVVQGNAVSWIGGMNAHALSGPLNQSLMNQIHTGKHQIRTFTREKSWATLLRPQLE